MKMTSCKIFYKPLTAALASGVACLGLVSLGTMDSVHAAPPEGRFVPSYAADPPLTVAALVQDESGQSRDEDLRPGLTVDDKDSTLREAMEMLKEKESLELVDGPGVDPIDDVESRSIFADRKTKLVNGRLVLPPIAALTTNTKEIGNGEVPLGFRQGAVSPIIALPESGFERELPWQWQAKNWAASNTFSHPLYFEDRMLERHGQRRYPYLQPFVSGGRFLAQGVMLPYLATISPPCECQYSLGYYRAGSCVPALKQRPPYQRKAAAAQAAAIVAAIAIIP